jgi:hypothetical protein
MFSLWPPDTRPSASEEADEILALANSFGPAEVEPNALRYITPKFELAAAAASGRSLGGRWRRGDLVSVRLQKLVDNAALPRPVNFGQPIWRRYIFDSRQIALRVSEHHLNRVPALIGIVRGNVVSDVSRRLAIRRKIDLWTSDNVAFSVVGHLHFAEALDQLAANCPQGMSEMAAKAYEVLREHGVVEPGPFQRVCTWQHLE